MRRIRAFWIRLRGLLPSARFDAELAQELESHLAMHIDDGIRSGLTPIEARRRALIKLGGLDQTHSATRERHTLPQFESFIRDITYGLRILTKNPGFTVVTVLTLALGIGANTALFSVVNAVLLNPLPFPNPRELVTINASKPNFLYGSISYLNFRDWQHDNHTLAALAVHRPTSFSLTGTGDAERVRAEYVSTDFFSILGLNPVIGRLFAPDEDQIGRGPVAVIGAGFWQRKFGGRSSVLGQMLTLDGRSFPIIGVLPPGLDLGNFRTTDVFVPIGQWPNTALKDRGAGLGIHGIARLKPGVTFEQAQDDMNAVSDRLAAAFPQDDHGIRARLTPMQQAMVGGVQPILLTLLGSVGFVLLIACVNVANLLLARSDTRAREFAVRFALGAGRGRIIRQQLTESTLLSLAGGVLGLILASWGTTAALRHLPATLPRSTEIHLNGTVLAFAFFLSVLTGIVFGLLPALKITHDKLHDALKEGGRGNSGARHRAQNALVVFEMALALVLLAGAGLMVRSLVLLSSLDPGFQPAGVVAFGLAAPPSMAHSSPESVRAYYREIHRRMKETPGIRDVSLSDGTMPMLYDNEQLFWLDNEPRPTNTNDMHWALQYAVEPGFLNVMRIPLLRGRFFTTADKEHSPRVVVIDDAFAKKFYGDQDPVGQHLNLDGFNDKATIVGVVGHILQWGLDSDATNSLRAQLYMPYMQLDDMSVSLSGNLATDVVARIDGDQAPALAALQHSLREMDREQVLWGVQDMSSVISDSLAQRRFSMILLAVFAGFALLLASVGIYGVISYLVGQRTHEIGVRIALGADRGDILRWVLRHGGRLALLGAGSGLLAALALTRIMSHWSLLYGVRNYDPLTLTTVTLILVLVAVAASCIPAVRAMRTDPIRALRNE